MALLVFAPAVHLVDWFVISPSIYFMFAFSLFVPTEETGNFMAIFRDQCTV